jgi:hypothetical protein
LKRFLENKCKENEAKRRRLVRNPGGKGRGGGYGLLSQSCSAMMEKEMKFSVVCFDVG